MNHLEEFIYYPTYPQLSFFYVFQEPKYQGGRNSLPPPTISSVITRDREQGAEGDTRHWKWRGRDKRNRTSAELIARQISLS